MVTNTKPLSRSPMTAWSAATVSGQSQARRSMPVLGLPKVCQPSTRSSFSIVRLPQSALPKPTLIPSSIIAASCGEALLTNKHKSEALNSFLGCPLRCFRMTIAGGLRNVEPNRICFSMYSSSYSSSKVLFVEKPFESNFAPCHSICDCVRACTRERVPSISTAGLGVSPAYKSSLTRFHSVSASSGEAQRDPIYYVFPRIFLTQYPLWWGGKRELGMWFDQCFLHVFTHVTFNGCDVGCNLKMLRFTKSPQKAAKTLVK